MDTLFIGWSGIKQSLLEISCRVGRGEPQAPSKEGHDGGYAGQDHFFPFEEGVVSRQCVDCHCSEQCGETQEKRSNLLVSPALLLEDLGNQRCDDGHCLHSVDFGPWDDFLEGIDFVLDVCLQITQFHRQLPIVSVEVVVFLARIPDLVREGEEELHVLIVFWRTHCCQRGREQKGRKEERVKRYTMPIYCLFATSHRCCPRCCKAFSESA